MRMRAALEARPPAAVGTLLLTTPVIFHVASVANLQLHWMPLLVYLTLFALAGVRGEHEARRGLGADGGVRRHGARALAVDRHPSRTGLAASLRRLSSSPST